MLAYLTVPMMLATFPIGGLTLTDVKKVAHGARSKWFDIGIELDLKLEDLKVYSLKSIKQFQSVLT